MEENALNEVYFDQLLLGQLAIWESKILEL